MKRTTCMRWSVLAALCLGSPAALAQAAAPPETLYPEAVELLFSGQYPEAERLCEQLRTHHPYSRYAPLAELRQADAQRLRGQPLQAIEAYRSFLKFHPTHPQADYARLQIAEAYHSQLPQSWGILPPAAEKDQQAVRQAVVAYDAFLTHAGPAVAGSLAQARTHREACVRQLAFHELYVARYYFKRAHFAAAAGRAELVLENFAALGMDDEALLLAGRSRAALGEAATARLHLHRLLEEHPRSPHALPARQALQQISAPAPETPET